MRDPGFAVQIRHFWRGKEPGPPKSPRRNQPLKGWVLGAGSREVDVRLPGKGDSNFHGARPGDGGGRSLQNRLERRY